MRYLKFILLTTILFSCVSKSRETELLEKIDKLESEIDDLKNGEERLLARIEYSFENEMFDSVRVYASRLKRKFPESDKIEKLDELVQVVAKIEAEGIQKALEEQKEKERLANLNNTGMWTVSNYVDEFGRETPEEYIRNRRYIEGKFSNSATTNSDLNVKFLITNYNDIDIMLYEYAGNNPVKTYGTDNYRISFLHNNSDYLMRGTNYGDRISIQESDAIKIHNALKKGGKYQFSIKESGSPTVYNFTFNSQYYGNAYRIMIEGN